MKEVLITGGAGGIGSAIVDHMIKRDFCVHIIDTDLDACKRLVKKYGSNIIKYYSVDVTNANELLSLASELCGKVHLDHIITLAGRALADEWRGFIDSPITAIQGSINLNLVGHLQTIHAFMPLVKNTGNRSVLLISSINALSDFGIPIYSSAKAGLVGFVNSAVGEFGARGIRVNAVLPGTVVTPATKNEPKDFDRLLQTTTLNYFTTPEDVATLVGAITCDFVSMTGQSVVLDAGQSKKHLT